MNVFMNYKPTEKKGFPLYKMAGFHLIFIIQKFDKTISLSYDHSKEILQQQLKNVPFLLF